MVFQGFVEIYCTHIFDHLWVVWYWGDEIDKLQTRKFFTWTPLKLMRQNHSLLQRCSYLGGSYKGFATNQKIRWNEVRFCQKEQKSDAKTLASGPRQMLPEYRAIPEKIETSFQHVKSMICSLIMSRPSTLLSMLFEGCYIILGVSMAFKLAF